MARKLLFMVAAILHPEKNEKGVDIGDSKLILEPKNIMASSEKVATQLVVRELPEDVVDKLDRIDIMVSTF